MNNTIVYASLMLLAGLGIPMGAALNGGLGTKLQSTALATVILFIVGLLAAILYLLISEGITVKGTLSNVPWYYYCSGLFMVFYVSSITWVAPRFGVANAVAFVLLGQLIAISLIDHFGFAGMVQYPVTAKRLAGLLIMAVGIFMVLSKPQEP